MEKKVNYLKTVGTLVKELEAQGIKPVLVGGMALVILGSQRVTSDFDFLISLQGSAIGRVVDVFYAKNLELVSKFNKQGEVIRTIDNKNVATARLKLDAPQSAYFYDWKTELKVDLLFDFPLPALEIEGRALKINIPSYSMKVACREDLLRLKEIAYKDRKSVADAQDLEFLRKKIM